MAEIYFQMAEMERLPPGTKELLLKKRTQLLENIRTSPHFWSTLVKHTVLDNGKVNEIKVGPCIFKYFLITVLTSQHYI